MAEYSHCIPLHCIIPIPVFATVVAFIKTIFYLYLIWGLYVVTVDSFRLPLQLKSSGEKEKERKLVP